MWLSLSHLNLLPSPEPHYPAHTLIALAYVKGWVFQCFLGLAMSLAMELKADGSSAQLLLPWSWRVLPWLPGGGGQRWMQNVAGSPLAS